MHDNVNAINADKGLDNCLRIKKVNFIRKRADYFPRGQSLEFQGIILLKKFIHAGVTKMQGFVSK